MKIPGQGGGCRRQTSPKTEHNNSNNTTTATTQHGGRKTAHFGKNSSHTHAQWFLFSLKRTVASILVFLKVGQHPEPNTKVQGPGSCGPASAFIQKGPRNFPGQGAQCTPCQGHWSEEARSGHPKPPADQRREPSTPGRVKCQLLDDQVSRENVTSHRN